MADSIFRELLQSGGIDPKQFAIPQSVLNQGVQSQLDVLKNSYKWGDPSLAVVYDELPLEQTLSKIKLTLRDMFNCVDFPYIETRGKKKAQSAPSADKPTSGLLSHLFDAEETDFNQPTLILYHSFDGIPRGVIKLIKREPLNVGEDAWEQITQMTNYLDGGCGRHWTHAHSRMQSPRLPKLSGNGSLIRTAIVMSMDEKVANNWYNEHHTSCTRSHIGRDFRANYIF